MLRGNCLFQKLKYEIIRIPENYTPYQISSVKKHIIPEDYDFASVGCNAEFL